LDEAREYANTIKSESTSDVVAILQLQNKLDMALGEAHGQAELLQSVHPDQGVRRAGELLEQEASTLSTEMSLDRDLYDAFAALEDKADTLDDGAKRLLTKTLRDFRRSGVDRDDETRARIRVLWDRITEVGQTFGRNIREDTRFIELDSVEKLSGLPEDFIKTHQPDENGKIKLTTDWADYFPIISYADDDSVRHALWEKKVTTAYPTNLSVLKELLNLRHTPAAQTTE